MDFLPSLRLSGLFGPNSRNSNFGQPEIDNGNVGQMLRQIIPVARTMNDEEHRRRKDLMTHQANLELPTRGRRYINSRGPEGPRGPLTRSSATSPMNVNAPQAGMSPIQAMWGKERNDKINREHQMSMQQGELSGRFQNALAERKLQDQGAMDRLLTEIGSRERIAGEDRTSRTALENTKHQREVDAATLGHKRDLEKVTHTANETRRTNTERPDTTPQSQTDVAKGIQNRVAQMRVSNPNAYKWLVLDDEGNVTGFKQGINDAQRDNLVRYLYGGSATGAKK